MTALVHVSLEHTKLLGDTREAIAADKAQLADPGSILIVGPDVPGFEETPPRTPLPDRLGMRGPFQRVNARVALAATEAWLHDRFDPHLATGALQTARSPLRFERVADDVIIDVAHNVAGVQAVLEAVGAEIEGPLVLLVGVSRDRDYASMVPLLASIADFAVCTSAQKKGAPAATIAAHCPVEHVVIDDVADALRRARHEAKHRSATVLVTGGLFLAAEAARAI